MLLLALRRNTRALAAHPADDYIERHIVGNATAEHVFVYSEITAFTRADEGVDRY